jgi:uncharacterized membrane protein YgcG
MRSVHVRAGAAALAGAALTGSVLLFCLSTPALASSVLASSGAQCTRLQGLTDTDLCVTVDSTTSSVAPGGTATYSVDVAVEGGLTVDVTVAISASSGTATYASGCPDGDGSASCWIASLNLLGAPASYDMQVQVPVSAGNGAVTLSATASVPTLLPWTPPSAAASVAVSNPAPTASATPRPSAPPSSPSSAPGKTPAPHSSSGSGSGSGGSGSGGSGSRGAGTGSGGSGSGGSRGAGNGSGSTAVSTGGGSLGAGEPIPLGTVPTVGSASSVVSPGSASGLFPTISAGTPAALPTVRLDAVPAATGMPLAPAATVLGLLVALGGGAFAARDYLRKHARG